MPARRRTRRSKRITTSMLLGRERKRCPFARAGKTEIDYKDTNALEQYVGIDYKIIPSRVTGVSSKMQRKLALAIKRARFMAMLPYTDQHRRADGS